MRPARTASLRKWFAWLMLGVLVSSIAVWFFTRDRLPDHVRIATAKVEGQYYRFGKTLQEALVRRTDCRADVIATEGSVDNCRLLRDQSAQLAIVQTGTASLQELAVVAPLYRDVVHVIVRTDRDIQSIRDLKGKNVASGSPGSGMRKSSQQVLEHYGVTLDQLNESSRYFRELLDDPSLDAAVVTTGMQNPDLRAVLSSGQFSLLPLHAKALEITYAHFERFEIPQGYYGEDPTVPAEDIETVAAVAMLVARQDASRKLIAEVLDALYEEDFASQFPNLMSQDQAGQLMPNRLHSVSRRYYDPFDVGFAAAVMESLAAAKELLFAVGAGFYLLWYRWRQMKEREREEEVKGQKEHLDGFLEQTLRIERAQMDETDPQKLETFLDEVTEIKLEALSELTHEDLRGDRTFSIFLMQCANLIGKIQMKILNCTNSAANRRNSSE